MAPLFVGTSSFGSGECCGLHIWEFPVFSGLFFWVFWGKKYDAAPTSDLATRQPCYSSSRNRLTAGSSWLACICLALSGCSSGAVAVGTGPGTCRAGWLYMGSQHGELPMSSGSRSSRHRSWDRNRPGGISIRRPRPEFIELEGVAPRPSSKT